MKRKLFSLLIALALLAGSACGEASWNHLTCAENGYIYDEDGNLLGCDYEIHDAWEQAVWEAGGFTTMTAIAPAYVVDGIVYSRFGAVCGYTDEHTPNEPRYWTANKDPYYHKSEDCDGETKYPISAEAAEAFEKHPCPKCLLILDPQSPTEEAPSTAPNPTNQ